MIKIQKAMQIYRCGFGEINFDKTRYSTASSVYLTWIEKTRPHNIIQPSTAYTILFAWADQGWGGQVLDNLKSRIVTLIHENEQLKMQVRTISKDH